MEALIVDLTVIVKYEYVNMQLHQFVLHVMIISNKGNRG